MALLVGQEAEGGAAKVESVAEIAKAFRLEVLKTGTVNELHLKLAEAYTGTVDLAIATDAGAAEPPGAIKQEVTAVLAAETVAAIAITGVAVTKGTFVWLEFQTIAASKIKFGTTTGTRLGAIKHTKLSEAATWGALSSKNTPSIWGTGTEEEGTVAQCKTAVTLKDTTATQIQEQDQVKGGLVIKDTINASMIALAKAQAQDTFATQTTSQQRISAGVVAQYRFKDGATVEAMSKVQALSRLQFIDAATPNALMQAGARAKVLIADQASPQQIAQAAGSARLLFAGSATATASGESGSTRRISIFIFDD